MSSEYQGLNLDGLLHLSRTDAEYAGDMAEQARVLRQMENSLQDKVDLMRGVMTALFGDKALQDGDPPADADAIWTGDASRMMRTELLRLFNAAEEAPEVMGVNASAMDDFSTRVTNTLISIDTLHVRSKSHGSPDAEQSDIEQARQIMQAATTGYLETAKSMREPKFYSGLRQADSDAPSEPWNEQHGTPATTTAPQVTPATWQSAPSTGPGQDSATLQSTGTLTTTSSAPVASLPPTSPQATPWSPQVPATLPPVIGGRTGPTTPPPAIRPVPRTLLPPVIGQRPGITPVRPVPQPRSTLPPVIGQRPSAAPPPNIPVRRPGMTLPPVIGTRPGVAAPPSTIPRPGPTPVTGVKPGATTIPAGGVRPGTTPMPGIRPGATPLPVSGARPGATPLPGIRPGMTPTPGIGPGGASMVARPPVTGRLGVPPASRSPHSPPAARHTAPARTVIRAIPLAKVSRNVSATGQWIPRAPVQGPIAKPVPGQVTMRPVVVRAGQPKAKVPGQRVKRRLWRGEAIAERSVLRGSWRRRLARDSRPTGQDVFAKFDRQKKQAEEPAEAPTIHQDADSDWLEHQVTLPTVIGRRKVSDDLTTTSVVGVGCGARSLPRAAIKAPTAVGHAIAINTDEPQGAARSARSSIHRGPGQTGLPVWDLNGSKRRSRPG